jgi:hypothetical protein
MMVVHDRSIEVLARCGEYQSLCRTQIMVGSSAAEMVDLKPGVAFPKQESQSSYRSNGVRVMGRATLSSMSSLTSTRPKRQGWLR